MTDRRVTDQSAIEVRSLTKIFGSGEGAVQALDEVSVAIRENEFFTLLGPSGCGKTTLLRLVAGFEAPSQGQILLDGRDIGPLPPFRRPVNTVFQSYALFPHMSVAENVGFGLAMRGLEKAEIAATVEQMLDLVRLGGLAGRRPAQLSGGQQQRVALARALANHPKLLLLDEPLSALDLKLRKEMQLELKRLQRETGITFIFVTHDQEEALTMSDRLAVMNAGKILQVGSPLEIYETPDNRFVADFIGETNFLEARVEPGGDGAPICRLEGGARLSLPGLTADGSVTLAVRPEKIELAARDPGRSAEAGDGGAGGRLPGRVAEAVYQGTSTAYHVDLEAGGRILVRWANHEDGRLHFAVDQPVEVLLPPGAVRVLRQ